MCEAVKREGGGACTPPPAGGYPLPVPEVRFTPLNRSAETRPDETILDAARRAGVPVGNSCGAIGVCGRCVVRIVSGAEQLSPPTEVERTFGARRGIAPDERFACQAVVRGECEVTTSYW